MSKSVGAGAEDPPSIERTVGRNLRALRQDRGLTLERLSQMLAAEGHPMSLATISKAETGERGIGVDDLVAFARVLSVEPMDLMSETVSPQVLDLAQRWSQSWMTREAIEEKRIGLDSELYVVDHELEAIAGRLRQMLADGGGQQELEARLSLTWAGDVLAALRAGLAPDGLPEED